MAIMPWQVHTVRVLQRAASLYLRPLHTLTLTHPITSPNYKYRSIHCAVRKGGLTDKKCVPCNLKDLRPMTEESAHTLMPQVAEWNLVNEGNVLKLRRSWKVKTFTKGLEFFKIVAELAENEGHHPDLHLVGWNNVTIEIWTHAVGGLTENDFILAAKIDRLDLNDLLRRKPSD